MTVWTVGHSTLEGAAFLGLLQAHGIGHVADIRRYPASRRHPHFSGPALARSLAAAGVGYTHLEALGGRREPVPGSRNMGWTETGFRGYADHMETPAFALAMQQVIALSEGVPLALLCAEKNWRNCHRGLAADWLKARGIEVVHIADAERVENHPYTQPARVEKGHLTYPGTQPAQASLDFSAPD